MTTFDRKIFFDSVRESLFSGSLTQQQVDGMEYKLTVWEEHPFSEDLRFLAYPFATSYWETARTMWPIEEIGKGKGRKYGKPDPETGNTYYGRGDVQLTWKFNYEKATKNLGLVGPYDLVWHPEKALDPAISAQVMYCGMVEGWFTGKKLDDFFTVTKDDPVNARSIINNDVSKMGKQIAGYHAHFMDALDAAWIEPVPEGPEGPEELETVYYRFNVAVTKPKGVSIAVEITEELT